MAVRKPLVMIGGVVRGLPAGDSISGWQQTSASGDMTKAVYDSVGDGVVNASRSAPWSGVTGKPEVITLAQAQATTLSF